MFNKLLICSTVIVLSACGAADTPDKDLSDLEYSTKAKLGEALYSDKVLSKDETQSCASCHSLEHGFIDDRTKNDASGKIPAVSTGDNGTSLGDRNSPTSGYAMFSPNFKASATRTRYNTPDSKKTYTGAIGGQFYDGREADLKGQAGGPPTNPVEMNMADKPTVVARLKENKDYVAAFEGLYNDTIFDDDKAAYNAMAESIGEFEKTDVFATFDSKYDRSLKGEVSLTTKEKAGKDLFFNQDNNCAMCHQLNKNDDPKETFSSYEYHNLGVPENTAVRALNGVSDLDEGLLNNADINDNADKGKIKTSSLRNIAVTEPYMHNGVFRNLKTVLEFLDHYNNPARKLNPETGALWKAPEINENVATELLEMGDAFTDEQIDEMICFLRTLTDKKFEGKIKDKGVSCN